MKVLEFLSFFTHAEINGARKLVVSIVDLYYLQFGFVQIARSCCFLMCVVLLCHVVGIYDLDLRVTNRLASYSQIKSSVL